MLRREEFERSVQTPARLSGVSLVLRCQTKTSKARCFAARISEFVKDRARFREVRRRARMIPSRQADLAESAQGDRLSVFVACFAVERKRTLVTLGRLCVV